MSKERFVIHQHLTDRIVAAIEAMRDNGRCRGTGAAAG